jgi:hypothetical protein
MNHLHQPLRHVLSHMMGERAQRPLDQAYGLARLLLGRVTTCWPILLHKGIPGDTTVIVSNLPLFFLLLLISV